MRLHFPLQSQLLVWSGTLLVCFCFLVYIFADKWWWMIVKIRSADPDQIDEFWSWFWNIAKIYPGETIFKQICLSLFLVIHGRLVRRLFQLVRLCERFIIWYIWNLLGKHVLTFNRRLLNFHQAVLLHIACKQIDHLEQH